MLHCDRTDFGIFIFPKKMRSRNLAIRITRRDRIVFALHYRVFLHRTRRQFDIYLCDSIFLTYTCHRLFFTTRRRYKNVMYPVFYIRIYLRNTGIFIRTPKLK